MTTQNKSEQKAAAIGTTFKYDIVVVYQPRRLHSQCTEIETALGYNGAY